MVEEVVAILTVLSMGMGLLVFLRRDVMHQKNHDPFPFPFPFSTLPLFHPFWGLL